MTPSMASPYAMHPVQFSSGLTHHFSASPLKRGICSKPSRKASLHPLPHAQSLPQGQTKELPPPLSSEDPGQLLTGSGLGHDCSVAPAGSSRRSPPAFASSSRAAPASPSSAREPHPLSPSNLRAALKNLNISGQMAGPGLCPKSSTGGHLWDNHGGRVGPESNSWCSIPPCLC